MTFFEKIQIKLLEAEKFSKIKKVVKNQGDITFNTRAKLPLINIYLADVM